MLCRICSQTLQVCVLLFPIFINPTCWNPRLPIPSVPRPNQSPHAPSLCPFTSSPRTHTVRREKDPVSSDRYGLHHPFSGPGGHSCPACYGPTNLSARSTSTHIPQIPMDDRRQSRFTFPFEEKQTLQVALFCHGGCDYEFGCALCDPHYAHFPGHP